MDKYGSSDADSANMAPDNYIPRISDIQLRKELAATGAVLILGPKWSGKTTSAERMAKSTLYMQDPDNRDIGQGDIKFSKILSRFFEKDIH